MHVPGQGVLASEEWCVGGLLQISSSSLVPHGIRVAKTSPLLVVYL